MKRWEGMKRGDVEVRNGGVVRRRWSFWVVWMYERGISWAMPSNAAGGGG